MKERIPAYALFAACLSIAVGCAQTDYDLVTDSDQTLNGQGSGVVNTNGKAHFGKAMVAIVWPDGNDELFAFVDQAANGDRVLTTYNNFSTGAQPTFHTDLYCNPDWQGCAIFTAPDPETGDVDPFDGRLNENCSGARSLSILTDTGRYYGECGRLRMPLGDRLSMLNMGRLGAAFGLEGLYWDLHHSNTVVELDNEAGQTTTLGLSGSVRLLATPGPRPSAVVDLTNPLLGSTARRYADFLRDGATHATTARVTYNGITVSFRIAGKTGPSSPERVRAAADSHY